MLKRLLDEIFGVLPGSAERVGATEQPVSVVGERADIKLPEP